MLTKLRQRLTKLSRDAGGLGDRAVEDDGDTCQDRGGGVADILLQRVWWFGPQNHRWKVFRVWASKPIWSSSGNGRMHVASSRSLRRDEA